jgi:hypothetical protein
MFTISLADLQACSACRLDYFMKKSNGQGVVEFPDGWQESNTMTITREDPVALFFLVSKGLIPVTVSEAAAAMSKVYGKTQLAAVIKSIKDSSTPAPPAPIAP